MGADADFETWYLATRPGLLRALWVTSGDLDLAAEVVDEACSRALARWERVSAMASPGGWVRTVALNLMRRAMRRRAFEERVLRRHHTRAGAEPAAPDVELWAAVADLPLRQREVVALRYLADCSEAQIAATLGISEGAASASLAKALRRLADVLGTDREVIHP